MPHELKTRDYVLPKILAAPKTGKRVPEIERREPKNKKITSEENRRDGSGYLQTATVPLQKRLAR